MSCEQPWCRAEAELPGSGARRWPGPGIEGGRPEVLDGRLVQGPRPSRRHDRVVGNLAVRFGQVLPPGTGVRAECPVSLPHGDAPVPDLVVCPAAAAPGLPAVPVREVATVVEVVAADGHHIDRTWKRELYAAAGIPCYWRVELDLWPGYRGPLPVVVIRVREPAGWREIVAPGGHLHPLPVAYQADPEGAAKTTIVRLNPGTLTARRATDR